jgi:hypothetical protein
MVAISPIVIFLAALLAFDLDVQRPVTPLQQTVHALRRIHTDCFDTGIPAQAKPLLAELKNDLEVLVTDVLADPRAAHMSASDLQSAINAKLKSDGVLTSRSTDDYSRYDYGDVFDVTVKQPVGHPDLLAVTATIGICCGEDTSFYVYRRHGSKWSIALAYTAGDYDDVSGAHGQVQVGISPADKSGKFFIVVANVNPWCTSNWQSLRYAVLRESSLAHKPHVLLEKQHSILLDDEPSYSLIVGPDSFSLVFLDEKFMELLNKGVDVDPNSKRAKRVLKYRVAGANVVKLIDR